MKMRFLIVALVIIIVLTHKEIERTMVPMETRLKVTEANQVIDAVKSNYDGLDYIPNSLILGIIETESNFNSQAVSKVGAQGMMQLMPQTFTYMCQVYSLPYSNTQAFDPAVNIDVGIHHLDWLFKQLHNWDQVIHAYNMGIGNVKKGHMNYLYFGRVSLAQSKFQVEGYA